MCSSVHGPRAVGLLLFPSVFPPLFFHTGVTSPTRPSFPHHAGKGRGRGSKTDFNTPHLPFTSYTLVLLCHITLYISSLTSLLIVYLDASGTLVCVCIITERILVCRWLLSGRSWWSSGMVRVERPVCSSSSVRTSSRRSTCPLCSRTTLLTLKWTPNRYLCPA